MSLKTLYENVPSDAGHYFANYNGPGDFLRHTTAHYDPIFYPLFISMGFTGTIGATGITTASVASAIVSTNISQGIIIK